MWGVWFRVYLRVQSLGVWVWGMGLEFRVSGFGFGVWGLPVGALQIGCVWLKDDGLGFRVWGLGLGGYQMELAKRARVRGVELLHHFI